LVLELVLLEDNCSRQPKRPPMAEEKRDANVGGPIKMLLEEALVRYRNEMMDNFAQITDGGERDLFDKQLFSKCNTLQGTNQF
jgi:hypothetical protein